MGKIYEDEYNDLLNIIYDKLNNNYLDNASKKVYLIYLKNLEQKVKDNPIKSEYEGAIDDLCIIMNEIKELDHSVVDNYHMIDFNKEELDEFINEVENNIDKIYKDKKNKKEIIKQLNIYRLNIKKLKHDAKGARTRLVASLLMLAILFAVPISTFFKIKRKDTYKIVYPTQSVMYSSNIPFEYSYGYYNSMPIVGSILSYTNDYCEFKYVGSDGYVLDENGYSNCYYKIIIKEPWEKIGREAVRTVTTCQVPVNMIGNIVTIDDINNLINTYGAVKEKEIIYANEIPKADREFYAIASNEGKNIYEVIRYTQNLSNPITIVNDKDYTDLFIILASEFLIWLCMIQFNQELIIGRILNAIKELIKNQELTKEQENKLRKLYRQYQSILEPINSKKRIKK